VKAATYTTSLPNAPKGEYAVVQFATAFSAKETPTKTVVPVLKDGRTWRVSAYFIK
jgi:hypothetical protein